MAAEAHRAGGRGSTAPPPCDGGDVRGARVVSHRGERDNRRVMDNTFAAVDPLADAGVWGVEFDLHWTLDDEPMVCHGADLRRVFGLDLVLAGIDYATLRTRCPQVPHLGDFVARYCRQLHLMMELKTGLERNTAAFFIARWVAARTGCSVTVP